VTTGSPDNSAARVFSQVSIVVRNGQAQELRGADLEVPDGRNDNAAGVADVTLGTEDFMMHFSAGATLLATTAVTGTVDARRPATGAAPSHAAAPDCRTGQRAVQRVG
jgi:hypothetical protein